MFKFPYLLLGDFVNLLLWVSCANLEHINHALLEWVEAAYFTDDVADLLDTLGGALFQELNPNRGNRNT